MSDLDKKVRRDRRRADVKRRLVSQGDYFERCRIVGCTRPTTAAQGKGFNGLYCRRHEDFKARHGSYVRKSFTAAELNPWRRAALQWLLDHSDVSCVLSALAAIEGLYAAAGPHVEAFRLAGASVAQRTAAHWARLRVAGVDPRLVLSAWLAVEARLSVEHCSVRDKDFRLVQVAKVVHRLASGSHRRWVHDLGQGRTRVTELHKYPESRGLVLRSIGRSVALAGDKLDLNAFQAAISYVIDAHQRFLAMRSQPRSIGVRRGRR